jgi:spore photoproduct lyase
MPIENWREHYSELLHNIRATLDFSSDLTFELISHRFTPGSKELLLEWYPNTSLEMDESTRAVKRNKFGGLKYVYTPDVMKELRTFFEQEIKYFFPEAIVLYWT